MIKTKSEFYFKKPVDIIAEVNRAKWVKLFKKNSPLDNVKAYMKTEGKRYSLSFLENFRHSKRLDVGQTITKVEIQTKKHSYISEDLYLQEHAPPGFRSNTSFFYSKGFSKKKLLYYKLLIPLSQKHDFYREIQRISCSSDGNYLRGSTQAVIEHDTLYVNIIKDSKQGYFLCIESKKRQSYEVFSEKAHAVKNGFGYLTGYLAGNKGYYFAYSKKEMQIPVSFYFCGFRNEIRSLYTPIHSNPYGYARSTPKLASKLTKDPTLREVSILEFSKLCETLHGSLSFSVVVLLILESSVASLLFMPGGFAIALETISDLIADTKTTLAPIKDKALSKAIRKELTDVIKTHSSFILPEDLKVLFARIDQINQTTNGARLKAPFDKLNIKLLPEDLVVLQTRNDFLHGRTPDIAKDGKERTTSKTNRELYYASMRFYTLLNILILKWVGFDGRVVNYPKINEHYTKIKLKEEPFRLI